MTGHRMDLTRVSASGLAAGSAYLLAQVIDLAVTGNRLDDRVLLGGMLPVPQRHARAAGTAMHLANSLAVSYVYHRHVASRLTGPGWRRGVTFALAENTALYPLALLEQFHPAIRRGELDSYRSVTAFAQQVWRHLAFGAVLGAWSGPRGR